MSFDDDFSNERKWLEFLEKQKARLLELLEAASSPPNAEGKQIRVFSSGDRVRIKFALSRFNEDQYGLCVSCGCPIEKDLLLKIPESPRCYSCRNPVHSEKIH